MNENCYNYNDLMVRALSWNGYVKSTDYFVKKTTTRFLQ